jgi:hypothetical protein
MERLTKLQEQLTKGTQSDDTMKSFELQILQLKQILTDLFDSKPIESPKSDDLKQQAQVVGVKKPDIITDIKSLETEEAAKPKQIIII